MLKLGGELCLKAGIGGEMAASGKKAWEARSTRGKLLRRVAGVAILGALAVTAPVIASGLEPTLRSTGTTQMESTPEVVYINSVSDPDPRLVNFNENWKFHLGDVSGDNAEVFDDSSWENVNLPHDYSIDQEYTAAGEAESGYKLGGIGWYRKSFEVGADLEGKTIRLDFDGVYMDATVWVNGHELGNHPYGYSPFSFDITDYLNYGGENSIAVKVNHQTPSSRWYSGSGIGRDVEIVVTDQVHVEKDGVVVIDKNKCVGCLTCVLVCPYGALAPSESGVMQKCELCTTNSRGEPACAAGCPNHAIVYEQRGEA